MAKKVKFDMDKIAEVADQLIAAKGTSILKNKVIREFAGTKGLDEYTIWRTFLLPEYKTTQKGVYDVAPLATKTEMQELLEEISEDVPEVEDVIATPSTDEWIVDDEDEDEDLDETKTIKDFESDFFEDDGQFDAMDFIGDAYNEYANSLDMD